MNAWWESAEAARTKEKAIGYRPGSLSGSGNNNNSSNNNVNSNSNVNNSSSSSSSSSSGNAPHLSRCQGQRHLLVRKCLLDCSLDLALVKGLDLFGKASELCRVTGTSLYAVLNRGSQVRICVFSYFFKDKTRKQDHVRTSAVLEDVIYNFYKSAL